MMEIEEKDDEDFSFRELVSTAVVTGLATIILIILSIFLVLNIKELDKMKDEYCLLQEENKELKDENEDLKEELASYYEMFDHGALGD